MKNYINDQQIYIDQRCWKLNYLII